MSSPLHAIVVGGSLAGLAASLALAGHGLVFAKAYGRVSSDSDEPLHTENRFRIASVSKPLTAIEIMRLAERGRLRLDQRVFGKRALLGSAAFLAGLLASGGALPEHPARASCSSIARSCAAR